MALRLLLLAHAFNGLTQRLHCALREAGHTVSVELDISDAVSAEAVALFQPDLVLAPFLKRRIPESLWSTRPCLVVHPGPPGDGGPAALDWAVFEGATHWGVTVLQATGQLDAGPVWAWRGFAVRAGASKASLYRHEVGSAAVAAVFDALQRFVPGTAGPQPPPALPAARGQWRGPLPPMQRAIDWWHDDTATVLRKIASAEGQPGLADTLFGQPCRLHDAHAASADTLARAPQAAPGSVVARRGPALLRRCTDGAVWIGHVVRPNDDGDPPLKLPATRAFAAECAALPELEVPLMRAAGDWDELHYAEHGPPGARVGWLSIDVLNGALSTRQCRRLQDALRFARSRDTQVLVLAGGRDFFCNGIHLHEIEAAAREPGQSAADASWANIQAIDDVTLELLTLTDRITVATLFGNAGAGGCFLAFAADEVWAHRGVVLNPHYRNMGNLHGSEYWTHTLPRRAGPGHADARTQRVIDEFTQRVMQGRLPMSAREAHTLGLVDALLADDAAGLHQAALPAALGLAAAHNHAGRVVAKQQRRAAEEAVKPLAAHRDEELQQMQRNFYGFDPSYHVARYHFVSRKPQAWTPRHLAIHRS